MLDLILLRAAQREAARQAVAHGAPEREIRGRAGDGKARALERVALRHSERALCHVRQLEVLEEEVEVFLLRQDETELVLSLAVAAAFRAASATGLSLLRQGVARHELLVSGQHGLALTAGALPLESRLADAVDRDRHLAALVDVLDPALLRALTNRLPNYSFRPAQKPLPVREAPPPRVQAPVDDVHGRSPASRISQPALSACTTRRACGPAARYSRGPPCA